MKAKQYYEKFKKNNPNKDPRLILPIFNEIFLEAPTIAEFRNVKTDLAMNSIFVELNQKAKAFIRIVNNHSDFKLKMESFEIFLKEQYPEIYDRLDLSITKQ